LFIHSCVKGMSTSSKGICNRIFADFIYFTPLWTAAEIMCFSFYSLWINTLWWSSVLDIHVMLDGGKERIHLCKSVSCKTSALLSGSYHFCSCDTRASRIKETDRQFLHVAVHPSSADSSNNCVLERSRRASCDLSFT
jgi:hypothetical protein